MRISTYLSHSYRLEDQDANREFWSLFSGEDFFFDVDPPSNTTIHAHLERMMRCSSCFVAIVNRRIEAGHPFCSRFVLYEFGLALQARKPRLVLVDDRIANKGGPFESLPDDEKHFFDFRAPLEAESELVRKIRALKARATLPPVRPRGPIGLLLPREGDGGPLGDPGVRRRIAEVASQFGFAVEEIRVPYAENGLMALDLEACEALALDVSGRHLPDWLFAYAYGRLLPTIKLAQLPRARSVAQIDLPPLVRGLQMDRREPAVEAVTYWRDADDLVYQLGRAFEKLDQSPTRLEHRSEGDLYFARIGRRPTRLFLSNAGADNALAAQLSSILHLHSIDHFQYKKDYADEGPDIPTSSDWEAKIRQELEACELFVALIGPTYHEKPWCVAELRRALERRRDDGLIVLPYKVGSPDVPLDILQDRVPALAPRQVTDRLEEDAEAARRIFDAIDDKLKEKDAGVWQARQPMLLGGSHELLVDELRRMPRKEWQSLLAALRRKGIPIREVPAVAPPRPRMVAEELLSEVQRALPSPKPAAAPKSTLAQLATAVAARVPEPRRKPLRQMAKRLRDAAARC